LNSGLQIEGGWRRGKKRSGGEKNLERGPRGKVKLILPGKAARMGGQTIKGAERGNLRAEKRGYYAKPKRLNRSGSHKKKEAQKSTSLRGMGGLES